MTENISTDILSDKNLIEMLAESVHNRWMDGRLAGGWAYGSQRNDEKKQHPSLIPYKDLPEDEKEYDRQTVLAALKGLKENGYQIVRK